MNDAPTEGDFAYVKIGGEGVFEGEVVSSGEDYEIRLKGSDKVVTASSTAVWTAPPSKAKT